ncbi:hypothetical protein [Microbulbifer sp. DLAB2-AA]|uniref:hypothetical protein n=1 Tax=Microbulbifer sp. DLAB2-AA TaxID=3243394 RepID=UPI004039A6EC
MVIHRYPVTTEVLRLVVGSAAAQAPYSEPVNYQLAICTVRVEIGRCRFTMAGTSKGAAGSCLFAAADTGGTEGQRLVEVVALGVNKNSACCVPVIQNGCPPSGLWAWCQDARAGNNPTLTRRG